MNKTTQTMYQQRLARVCDYIVHHLHEELTLQFLCKVAAFSEFHFHRIFSANMGMSVHRFVQLNKLKQACFQLAFEPDIRIIDIAFEPGFNNPETFTRAFKREFSQTPSQFRAQPKWQDWHQRFTFEQFREGTKNMNVNVVQFAETNIAYLSHIGAHDKVFETASKFISWRKAM